MNKQQVVAGFDCPHCRAKAGKPCSYLRSRPNAYGIGEISTRYEMDEPHAARRTAAHVIIAFLKERGLAIV